jgi:plastocyanin
MKLRNTEKIRIIMVLLAAIGILVLAAGCSQLTGKDVKEENSADKVAVSEADAGVMQRDKQMFQVKVTETGLIPEAVELQKGDLVEFVNTGDADFVVRAEDSSFVFELPNGNSVVQSFDKTGDYQYTAKIANEKNTARKTDQNEELEPLYQGIVLVK